MKRRLLIAAIALAGVAGCASGQTAVLDAPQDRVAARTVRIEPVPAGDTVAVDARYRAHFDETLAELIYGTAGFAQGDDLIVRYRVVQLDEGDRAGRWFWGSWSPESKGVATVEFTYLAPDGRELARIVADGEVLDGVTGGSMKTALERAAQEGAQYAMLNFGA